MPFDYLLKPPNKRVPFQPDDTEAPQIDAQMPDIFMPTAAPEIQPADRDMNIASNGLFQALQPRPVSDKRRLLAGILGGIGGSALAQGITGTTAQNREIAQAKGAFDLANAQQTSSRLQQKTESDIQHDRALEQQYNTLKNNPTDKFLYHELDENQEDHAVFQGTNGQMYTVKVPGFKGADKPAAAGPQQIAGRDYPLPKDVVQQKIDLANATRAPASNFGAITSDDSESIADAIISGDQPPALTGLYRNAAPVRAALARKGFDLTTADLDFKAIQKHLQTLNGAQQERLRQAVSFTSDSLGVIDQLYDEWKKVGPNSGFKVFNRAALAGAKQIPGRPGEIATNLDAQISDLISELGTVYKGGNSSTDESLRLAGENLKADWNEQTFKRAIQQIRKNLQIRSNSIKNSVAAGVSPNSLYNRDNQPTGDKNSMPPPGAKIRDYTSLGK